MKIAVLVLVLANLAVFGWLSSADGGRQEADLIPLATTGRKLTLLPGTAGRPAAAKSTGTMPQSAQRSRRAAPAIPAAARAFPPVPGSAARRPGGATSICLVWPAASATVAGNLSARLAAAGFSSHLFARKLLVPGDYHVVLSGFVDAAAAQSAAAGLRKGGMADLYLLPAAGTKGPSLSLGVFSDRDHAERRAARVRALGFDPRISADTDSRERRHLETRVPAATSVSALLRAVGVIHAPRRAVCAAPGGSANSGAPAAASAS